MSRTPLPAFGHFPSLPLGVQVVAGGTSRNPQIQSGPQGRLVYAAYSLHGEGELELCGRITAFRSVPHSDPGPRRTASPVWVCHLSLVPTLLSPHPWAPNLRSPSAPLSTPLARQQGKPTALVPGGGCWMPLCHLLPVTSGKGTTSVIVLRRAVLARLSPKHSGLRAGTWRVSADQGRCLQTGTASPTACLLILEARAFPLPLEAFTPATESVPTAVPDTTWAGWSWK